jgi:hypothetical protein
MRRFSTRNVRILGRFGAKCCYLIPLRRDARLEEAGKDALAEEDQARLCIAAHRAAYLKEQPFSGRMP